MPYVNVDEGVSLYVEDIGSESGAKDVLKPVLFIHGWPLSHEMFEYQFMALHKSGYRCIGIDLRGFGRSDKPWTSYNYDVFADDIKQVISALNLQGVTLVGFSMGGAIVMHYIAKFFSELVSKVVLMAAAAPSFTKRENYPYGLEKSACDDLIIQSNHDRPKMVSDFGKMFFKREDSQSREMSKWLFSINMAASPFATIKCLEELRDADLRNDMQVVNQRNLPVAIFHGTHDKICPFDFAKVMNQGIKGSRLIEFNESGHVLNIEEKDKTNEELMKFIG
ncbi:MAG TPA: alpha/beta hydrolase [Nitrososphaera sp.]|nr:alpha/beta hydrolase [Nitrososphaera sp.]